MGRWITVHGRHVYLQDPNEVNEKYKPLKKSKYDIDSINNNNESILKGQVAGRATNSNLRQKLAQDDSYYRSNHDTQYLDKVTSGKGKTKVDPFRKGSVYNKLKDSLQENDILIVTPLREDEVRKGVVTYRLKRVDVEIFSRKGR